MYWLRVALGWLTVVFLSLVPARGLAAQDVVLEVGAPAPAFQALADNGEVWRSEEVVGKRILVVFFYPAAMTGGCTAQACSFRDNRSALQELGAEVVGVSGDRLEGLRAFKGANQLNFPLLSDTAGVVSRAFGVPTRQGGAMTRVVDGQSVELVRDLTTARWTFIIDTEGRIAYKDTQVNAAGDGPAVVAAVRRLVRN